MCEVVVLACRCLGNRGVHPHNVMTLASAHFHVNEKLSGLWNIDMNIENCEKMASECSDLCARGDLLHLIRSWSQLKFGRTFHLHEI